MKKVTKITGAFIFLIISSYIITVHILISTVANNTPPADADYLVVLGARLHGKEMSLSLLNRVEEALNYLKENPNTKVIASGGQGPGEDITEAEAMFQYFKRNGIPEDRIIKEDQSTTTYENLLNSRHLINKEHSVIIVSNDFHLFRSTIIAERVGFDSVYTLPARTPKVVIIKLWIREYAAVLKTWVFDR